MAVTKLLRLKEAKGKQKAAHLKNNIYYICNPEKCGGGLWIGGNAGTTPEIIYETMLSNKKLWGKEDGSQGFHYVISFPPDLPITEELAYQAAEEFCRELLGERFYYVFAVHNDRPHMHVHVTFDSVSKEDGRKFHSPKGDWEKRIQPITDRICRKYKIPELSFTEEKRGNTYRQWKHDRQIREDQENKPREGREKNRENRDRQIREGGEKHRREDREKNSYGWYDLIREDIDRAVSQAETYEEFLEVLRENRYVIREGKYLSLRPWGKERAVRSSRLGRGYSAEEIRNRIAVKDMVSLQEKSGPDEDRREILLLLRGKVGRSGRGWKMTAFQKQFYRRWNNTFLRNRPGREAPWKYNRDAVRVRSLSDALKYMIDQDIGTPEELERRKEDAERRREALESERKALQTKLYRSSVYRSLRAYEKLQKASGAEKAGRVNMTFGVEQAAGEDRTSGVDQTFGTDQSMAELLAKIERKMTLEEAVAERDALCRKIESCKVLISQLKEEERLIGKISEFYSEQEPADLMENLKDGRYRGQESRTAFRKGNVQREGGAVTGRSGGSETIRR